MFTSTQSSNPFYLSQTHLFQGHGCFAHCLSVLAVPKLVCPVHAEIFWVHLCIDEDFCHKTQVIFRNLSLHPEERLEIYN